MTKWIKATLVILFLAMCVNLLKSEFKKALKEKPVEVVEVVEVETKRPSIDLKVDIVPPCSTFLDMDWGDPSLTESISTNVLEAFKCAQTSLRKMHSTHIAGNSCCYTVGFEQPKHGIIRFNYHNDIAAVLIIAINVSTKDRDGIRAALDPKDLYHYESKLDDQVVCDIYASPKYISGPVHANFYHRYDKYK